MAHVSTLVRFLFLSATAFAAPARLEHSPTPSRALSSATESAVFQTVYWPFSGTVSDASDNSNDLPPVAAVLSNVALGRTGTHTLSATLTSTPISSTQIYSPELLVPTATTSTLSAPTAAATTSCVPKGSKYKIYAVVVGCLLGVFIIAGTWNVSCRGRKRDRELRLGEKGVVLGDREPEGASLSMRSEDDEKRARQSWWTSRDVEIDIGAGMLVESENTGTPTMDVVPPPLLRKSEVETVTQQNVVQGSITPSRHLRRSISSPLLATPSPIRLGVRTSSESESVLDETELLASLNLDHSSSGSSSSSFATAEAHPVWFFPPVAGVHSRTKSAPGLGERSVGSVGSRCRLSEWDIVGDYGALGVERMTWSLTL